MIKKPYIVQLSNGERVNVRSDELDAIYEGVNTGSLIKLKQAIINPSFIVAITFDADTWREFLNHIPNKNGDELRAEREHRRSVGMISLKDLFEEQPKKQKRLDSTQKKLSS